jgi:ArsR family transcriptional regulator
MNAWMLRKAYVLSETHDNKPSCLNGTDQELLPILSALGDIPRLKIMRLLRIQEQCVCNLTKALELKQSTVSHHLRILKDVGLVRDRRDADDSRWIYYSINDDRITLLRNAISMYIETTKTNTTLASCEHKFAKLNRCCRCKKGE